jgi:hypothetical protein
MLGQRELLISVLKLFRNFGALLFTDVLDFSDPLDREGLSGKSNALQCAMAREAAMAAFKGSGSSWAAEPRRHVGQPAPKDNIAS